MARWQGDARGRLAKAALALYSERGFDNTTVADIAQRAGLTERTLFRHYADKREVLFAGSHELEDLMAGGVAAAPDSATPIDAATAGLNAAAELLEQRRELVRQRQAIVALNPDLRERELIKLASLSNPLRRRGVREPAASLTSEMAIGVFKVAFERWIHDVNGRTCARGPGPADAAPRADERAWRLTRASPLARRGPGACRRIVRGQSLARVCALCSSRTDEEPADAGAQCTQTLQL